MAADYTIKDGLLKIHKKAVKEFPLEAPLFWSLEETDDKWASIRDCTKNMHFQLVVGIRANTTDKGRRFCLVSGGGDRLWDPFPTLREALAFAYTHAIINQ